MTLKKCGFTLISALLILTGICNADESGPSNTVGFWKINVYRGYNQISFPLLPADKTLNYVIGNQLTGGISLQESDQIMRWNAAAGQFQISWYNTSTSTWQGDFNLLSEAESYWIYIQPTHPVVQTVVACGNVIEQPVYDMGLMDPGYNAVGSVWAAPVPLAQAGLGSLQGGLYLFLSDQILSYDATTSSFKYAWRNDDGIWQGTLTALEPLQGYWIYVAPGHTGFHWTNYPQPTPNGLIFPTPVQSDQISRANKSGIPSLLPPIPKDDSGNRMISPSTAAPVTSPVEIGGGE